MQKEVKRFGSKIPWAEPSWYNEGNASPYYQQQHCDFRAKIREFVEKQIIPNRETWENNEEIPRSAFKQAGDIGLLSCVVGWPEESSPVKRPEKFDPFFMVVAFDELCHCASGGIVWGLVGGLGIGLGPVIHQGPEWMQEKVVRPCLSGDANIALAVSEATAGSDVASLSTTAEEVTVDGKEMYKVNGLKKWITCGYFADFFTVAARTGGEGSGMMGISLILVEGSRKGVSRRKMDCMGAKGSGTAYIEFDDVLVPKENYIGDVTVLMRNFVSERIGIAVQANRFARELLRETIEHARRRKAFGKPLVEQPVVRQKIANMAMEIECTQSYIDSLAYRMAALDEEDWFQAIMDLGAESSLIKVKAGRTFEMAAREAALVHGGNSYVRGNRVEHLYRHVLSLAIPGGSEDVLVDAAARLALKGQL